MKEAAIKLFSERGYDGTGTRNIAAHACREGIIPAAMKRE
ncbi:TetR family transcriptional regulator [Nocardia gamkensis]